MHLDFWDIPDPLLRALAKWLWAPSSRGRWHYLGRMPAPLRRWPRWLLAFGSGLDLRALGLAQDYHSGVFHGWWVSVGFVREFASGGGGSPAQETLRAEVIRQGGDEALYRTLLSCYWTFLDTTDIASESNLLRMQDGKALLDAEHVFFQDTVKWWLREVQPRRPVVVMTTEETRPLMSWGHHQWLSIRHDTTPFDWNGATLEAAMDAAASSAAATAALTQPS